MVDARLGKSDERRRGRRRIGGRRGRGGSRRRDEEEEKEKGEDGTDASSETGRRMMLCRGFFAGPTFRLSDGSTNRHAIHLSIRNGEPYNKIYNSGNVEKMTIGVGK